MKALILLIAFLPLLLTAKNPDDILSEAKPLAKILKKEKKEEALLLYNWLANTSETRMHQLRGATENRLFISDDGHKEVVFDESGKLVKDNINDGSYNYAHPIEDPANHFALDILPWVVWGYSREDPTSIDERIIAFSEALGGGLVASQENQSSMVKKKISKEEREALAVILKVIQEGKIEEEIYKIIKNSNYMPEDPYSIGDGLTEGLMKVMK